MRHTGRRPRKGQMNGGSGRYQTDRPRLAALLGVVAVLVLLVTAVPASAAEDPATVGGVDTSQGIWYLRDTTKDTTTFYYGNPGDFPIMGDWDCNGVDTPGLYRQSDGFVYLRNSNTQGIADIRFFFGNPEDVPLAGDFNGDGCDTVSIYRPSEQRFYIINKLGANEGGLGAAETDYVFGDPGDKPFVGDFDGDGVDTVGLHRESTGLVYFRNSHTQGIADNQFIFGDPGDRLVAGDWNANGVDSPGLFRRIGGGGFYLRYANTQGNADESFPYRSNLVPVAGNFGSLPGGESVFFTMDEGLSIGFDPRTEQDRFGEFYGHYRLWDSSLDCPVFDTRGCTIDIWSRAGTVVVTKAPDGAVWEESLMPNSYPVRFIPIMKVIPGVSAEGVYEFTFKLKGGVIHTATLNVLETRRVDLIQTGLTRLSGDGTLLTAYSLGGLDLSDAEYVGRWRSPVIHGTVAPPLGYLPQRNIDTYFWISSGELRTGQHTFFAKLNGRWYYARVG